MAGLKVLVLFVSAGAGLGVPSPEEEEEDGGDGRDGVTREEDWFTPEPCVSSVGTFDRSMGFSMMVPARLDPIESGLDRLVPATAAAERGEMTLGLGEGVDEEEEEPVHEVESEVDPVVAGPIGDTLGATGGR